MKRILLVCDTRGWGGWERGEKIQTYLSDEYLIDLMDSNEFVDHEYKITSNFIQNESMKCWSNNKYWKLNRGEFLCNKLIDEKFPDYGYDLYYLLFHTMLGRQDVLRLIEQGRKIVSIVTGYPIVKQAFAGIDPQEPDIKENFLNTVKLTNGIFANNKLAYNDLRRMVQIPVSYVPRGVDPDIFYPESVKRSSEPTAIYVGKPVNEKGLESIIRPACEIAGFKLVTNTRNYTNALNKEEMRNFYNQGDVYIVASTIDGTPNPALEAASCGKPIISNSIGNMPEFIMNGENGFLIKRKIEDYVKKLIWMKSNMSKVKIMGECARKTVLNGWTWKHSMIYERNAINSIWRT